jgi:hypothetical protein
MQFRKKNLGVLLTCISFCICNLVSSSANGDLLNISLTGDFDSISGIGHPDIDIGDSYEWNFMVDDSNVTGSGTSFLNVSSILSEQLLINGTPLVGGAPTVRIDLFFSGGQTNIQIAPSFSNLNRAVLNPSVVGGNVGTTLEFSDWIALDDGLLTSSDFNIRGIGLGDAIRSSGNTLTVTSVPEPAVLPIVFTTAVLNLVRRRR